MRAEMPSIMTISSHVAYGAVGNRIMVPALEALGISVTALSTVELPWHPGMNAAFGKGARIVPDDDAFAAMIDCLCNAPWLGEMDGMITGYLGSPAQAAAIATLVLALKRANPAALYLCDPVIGDTNGLYVPEATANAIRDQLWPLADIVTPNLFEFGWMTGKTLDGLPNIVDAAKAVGKRHVVVTSIAEYAGQIGNLLVSEEHAYLVSHEILSPTPNGTGDLLAALFLGNLINNQSAQSALSNAAGAVFAAIKDAAGHPSLAPEHLSEILGKDLAQSIPKNFDAKHIGVDGCKGGWVACWREKGTLNFEVFKSFFEITRQFPTAIIAVDMPIGLPDKIGEGGRGPEAQARKMLKGKSSSVFSMISRAAILADTDYVETCRLARQDSTPPRGISQQGFNILPKVRELDQVLRADSGLLETVFETHPELALAVLTKAPVLESKTKKDGQMKRIEILKTLGLPIEKQLPRLTGAKLDDMLDAAICLIVAERIANGQAQSFPSQPALDSHGIPIAIWA
jgi:pyridoxine kinase